LFKIDLALAKQQIKILTINKLTIIQDTKKLRKTS